MYAKPKLEVLGTVREATRSTTPLGSNDSTFHLTPDPYAR
jgi:hypothetical protein